MCAQKSLGHKEFGPRKIMAHKNFGPNNSESGSLFKVGLITDDIYGWWGQMLPVHMLPGQMSLWQLAFVNDVSKNLPL